MSLHPDVRSALQSAHDLEATASEQWHKQEHNFKQGDRSIPKLAKLFDKLHKGAYGRQHDLRNHMMKQGNVVETNLGDTSYEDDPAAALKSASKTLGKLNDAHRNIQETADAHDDRETCEKFHGVCKGLECKQHKVDQKVQQAKDLGPALFIAKHS